MRYDVVYLGNGLDDGDDVFFNEMRDAIVNTNGGNRRHNSVLPRLPRKRIHSSSSST